MNVESLPVYNSNRMIKNQLRSMLYEKLSIYSFISSNNLFNGFIFRSRKIRFTLFIPFIACCPEIYIGRNHHGYYRYPLEKTASNIKERVGKLLILGGFQTAGVMGCIFLSLRTITASESSILTFTNPLLVVLFATLFTKARYHVHQWVGVFLGLIGVMITMGAQVEWKIGLLFGFLSAVFWAIATLLAKEWGRYLILGFYQPIKCCLGACFFS